MEKFMKSLLFGILLLSVISCTHIYYDSESTDSDRSVTGASSSVPSDATAIVDFYSFTSVPSNVSCSFGGSFSIASDDTYGHVLNTASDGSSWGQMVITPDESLDLSKKTLYIVMKGYVSGFVAGSDSCTYFGGVTIKSSDDNQSVSSNYEPKDEDDFKVYSAAVNTSNFSKRDDDKDDSGKVTKTYSAANFSSINSIVIGFGQCKDLQIASIYYK